MVLAESGRQPHQRLDVSQALIWHQWPDVNGHKNTLVLFCADWKKSQGRGNDKKMKSEHC